MLMRPMSVAFRRHDTYHKIKELLSPHVVTLFFTSKNNKEWGYDMTWMGLSCNTTRTGR